MQIGAACTIHLRFGPTVTGTRSSALTVSSNDTAGPLQIALAGTGSALVPGPVGRPGPFGAIGLTGVTGPAGANGATGVAGQHGNNGLVQLVSCKPVSRTVVKRGAHGKRKKVKVTRQVCTTKTVAKTVKPKRGLHGHRRTRDHRRRLTRSGRGM